MQASETCPAEVRRVQSWFWRGPCGSCVGPGKNPHALAALPASVVFWSLLLSGPSLACRLPICSGAPIPRTGVRAGGQTQLLPGEEEASQARRRRWPVTAAPTRVLSRADPARASSRSLSRRSPASGECWLCGHWGRRSRPQNTLRWLSRATTPTPQGVGPQVAGCSRK